MDCSAALIGNALPALPPLPLPSSYPALPPTGPYSTGTIRETPSSTHSWMMNSILSPLGRPWYRVTSTGRSVSSTGSGRIRARTRLLSISAISHRQLVPFPSLKRICFARLHPQHIFHMVHIRPGDGDGLRLRNRSCVSKKMIHGYFSLLPAGCDGDPLALSEWSP